MKIDKAIEILIDDKTNLLRCSVTELREAKQLGIEALKRVEAARVKGTIWDYSLLPGETK